MASAKEDHKKLKDQHPLPPHHHDHATAMIDSDYVHSFQPPDLIIYPIIPTVRSALRESSYEL